MVTPINNRNISYANKYLTEDSEKDIKQTLKEIAKNLGYSYIETRPTIINTNDITKGTIEVGNVIINITYKSVITDINVTHKKESINCTKGIKELTTMCTDLQTASMIIKTILDSNLMD